MIQNQLLGFYITIVLGEKMDKSINYIKEKIKDTPEIGIILGSGLGDFADSVEDQIEIY